MKGTKMLGRKIAIIDDDESRCESFFFVLGTGQ
jgi:hypothetical protein